MLPVTLVGPKNQVKIIAFFDCGSTISLIDSIVAQKLGCDRIPTKTCIQGFKSSTLAFEKVSFKIEVDGKYMLMVNVLAVENLHLPSQSISKEIVEECKQQLKIDVCAFDGEPKF